MTEQRWRLKLWHGIRQWNKMEEFEIKFLEVDVPALEKKLLEIGAEKVGEYEYRVAVFDYPDWRLNENHAWLRLRTDGLKATLAYKQRLGVKTGENDEGMKEIEVSVDDFDKTYQIFKSIGFITKREEEKKRTRYKKGDAEFDIDFWPEIPAYVEIEGKSIEEVHASCAELGFDPKDGLICSAKQVYKKYGIEPDDYSELKFSGMVKK